MAKYFSNVNTLEELRKQYKNLLKKRHPDNPNGDTEITKDINAEYDQLFKILKSKHENRTAETDNNTAGSDTKASYNNNMYDWENDKALRDILGKIINFSGIEIEIVGQWIWFSGNTYSCKKELKEIGFKWTSQKKQWFRHDDKFQKKPKTPEFIKVFWTFQIARGGFEPSTLRV